MSSPCLKVALLGAGLIGSDLLVKIRRSKLLDCTIVAGRNRETVGLRRAVALGYSVTDGGIEALLEQQDRYGLVFDATDATSHKLHWELLEPLNKKNIDLTPSGLGCMVVPCVNSGAALLQSHVSMITCGGQAGIPVLAALSQKIDGIRYIEMVTTASSSSIGSATRRNLDEYIETTESAIRAFTKVQNVKTLVNISPAQPPCNFRVTISLLVPELELKTVSGFVQDAVKAVQLYVPGYRLLICSLTERERIFITIEVDGHGDLLPKYAGNLDIMNAAAVTIAEQYALEHNIQTGSSVTG